MSSSIDPKQIQHLAALIKQLPNSIKEFHTQHLDTGIRRARTSQLVGQIVVGLMPAVGVLELRNPSAADLLKRRLYHMDTEAINCSELDVPEFAATRKRDTQLSDCAARVGTFLAFCHTFAIFVRALAAELADLADGGVNSSGTVKRKKSSTGKKRGRKPATDEQIKEACEVRIEYQQKGLGPKAYCDWRNGDEKVGRVGVRWLNAKLALVRKLLRESPDRIPKRFANKIKPLRRVKRAV